MISRREFDAALDRLEPAVRSAVLRAFARITSRAQLERLGRAIVDGRLDDALRFAGIRPGSADSIAEAIRAAYFEGGQLAATTAPAAVGFEFAISNPRAERWLREHSSRLITRINAEQREVIRELIAEATAQGRNPRNAALDLVGRIDRRAGRRVGGIINLTPQQARYVRQMREALRNAAAPGRTRDNVPKFWIGENGELASVYTRRDLRFDPMIKRALQEGRPLSAGDVSRVTTRYADSLLQLRGETIARTETLSAVSASQEEAFSQAIDQGMIDRNNATRVWRTAFSRVRDSHASMNGQEREVGQPFISGMGSALMYPGDTSSAPPGDTINCRCQVQYRVDWIEEGAR